MPSRCTRSCPAWGGDISGITELSQLPATAQDYLRFVEEQVGVPVAIVGVGQRRDQTVTVREFLSAAVVNNGARHRYSCRCA